MGEGGERKERGKGKMKRRRERGKRVRGRELHAQCKNGTRFELFCS